VRVLALESATDMAGVALADDVSGVLASATLAQGRRHAESIAPAVRFVCAQAGVALGEVDAVAVDIGPGLFTGLRVGVASAKALAFGLGVPVVGVSSLEVLAQALASALPDPTLVVPVIDARRGEVFAARYRVRRGEAAAEGDEVRRTPEALAQELAALGEPVVLAGTGARRYRAVLAVRGASTAGALYEHPRPDVVAALGLARVAAGAVDDPLAVVPNYLREADARINWEQRAPRAAVEV